MFLILLWKKRKASHEKEETTGKPRLTSCKTNKKLSYRNLPEMLRQVTLGFHTRL
jgi:hypothetical protein